MTNIATTILEQLGANRFAAMTGAKNFANHGNALSFKLPANFASQGINYVNVELNALDLYDITYGKIWGTKYKVLKEVTDIYCDQLQSEFTATTGLDTHL
jgi:hypothetical protein